MVWMLDEYETIHGGHYPGVITGKPIPLDELKYWSVERQEAYVDVEASLKRELEFMKRG